MQAKHLCVLNHILTRAEVGTIQTGLSSPVKYFTDRSKAEHLLWIICAIMSYVCHDFACSLLPCGHLLGKS